MYTWIDGTPYIYNNNIHYAPSEWDLLKTSRKSPHYEMDVTETKFVGILKDKLRYAEIKLKVNRTNNLCTSGFLSYFTTALWVPIGCHDIIEDNHFLCEAPAGSNYSRHEYLFSNNVCRYGDTFLNQSCWIISAQSEQNSVHVHVHTKPLHSPLFFGMLSTWSLGNADRRTLFLETNETHTKCLETSDFDYQYFKKWVTTYNCKPKYYLVERNLITYKSMCNGK